jgi:hypothetical protein
MSNGSISCFLSFGCFGFPQKPPVVAPDGHPTVGGLRGVGTSQGRVGKIGMLAGNHGDERG